jgi:hypothetical protein
MMVPVSEARYFLKGAHFLASGAPTRNHKRKSPSFYISGIFAVGVANVSKFVRKGPTAFFPMVFWSSTESLAGLAAGAQRFVRRRLDRFPAG